MLESISRPRSLTTLHGEISLSYTDGVDRDLGLLSHGSTRSGLGLVVIQFVASLPASMFQLPTTDLKILNCFISCCLFRFKTFIQSRVTSKQLSTYLILVNNFGPNTDPCRTPHVRWVLSEEAIFT